MRSVLRTMPHDMAPVPIWALTERTAAVLSTLACTLQKGWGDAETKRQAPSRNVHFQESFSELRPGPSLPNRDRLMPFKVGVPTESFSRNCTRNA